MNQEPPRETLTVKEAAGRLGVAPITIYRAITKGEVPGVIKLGRCLRLNKKTFEEWIAQ